MTDKGRMNIRGATLELKLPQKIPLNPVNARPSVLPTCRPAFRKTPQECPTVAAMPDTLSALGASSLWQQIHSFSPSLVCLSIVRIISENVKEWKTNLYTGYIKSLLKKAAKRVAADHSVIF